MFPLWPLSHSQHRSAASRVNSKGPAPLQPIRCSKTKKEAQMKEQSKTSERELSEEEITNLSDGEFKSLEIKMLTDLIELGQKMKKTM